MVLIIHGNSEIVAHVQSENRQFDLFKAFVYSESRRKFEINFRKDFFFLHMNVYTTRSSYHISTIFVQSTTVANYVRITRLSARYVLC